MTPTEKSKKYYEANKRKVYTRHVAVKRICADYVRGVKTNHPCTDCSVIYPYYVMDFDHLGNKLFDLGNQSEYTSLERVKKEIAKCDLVCANCHRIRTHKRKMGIDIYADLC